MLRTLRESASEIIGGIVVAAVLGVTAIIFPGGWVSAWSFVADSAIALWAWLSAPALVPTGILIALIACAGAVVALPAIMLWAASATKPGTMPPTAGEVFGIVWRWSPTDYGSFHSLTPFCPECDYQMHPRNTSGIYSIYMTSYVCERCKWQSEVFRISPNEVEDRVRRELQRKVRQASRKSEGE